MDDSTSWEKNCMASKNYILYSVHCCTHDLTNIPFLQLWKYHLLQGLWRTVEQELNKLMIVSIMTTGIHIGQNVKETLIVN